MAARKKTATRKTVAKNPAKRKTTRRKTPTASKYVIALTKTAGQLDAIGFWNGSSTSARKSFHTEVGKAIKFGSIESAKKVARLITGVPKGWKKVVKKR